MSLNEKSPSPPVTKTQSLADILNEIESRANKATVSHRYEDHRDAFQDVPKLVKALREALKVAKTMPAMAYERITDNCLVDALPNDLQCDYDFLEQSLAAILTSPENGEQQRQSLGEH